MANSIRIKYSNTAAAVPSSLEDGELAINTADGKLYWKNNSGTIVSANLLSPGASDLTGITNATANSGYPTGAYAFNAVTGDGFPVDGRLTGAKNGTLNAQRLQSWATGSTYARYWINGTSVWSSWSLYLDALDFTAKGQSHFASGSNAYSVLSVGANGTVLTADSAEAMGVKWAAPAAATSNLGAKLTLVSPTGAFSNTEGGILQYVIPANTMAVGRAFRIRMYGTCTSTAANSTTFRIRIGTAGSTADAIVSTIISTAAATGTNIPFTAEFIIVIRTAGAAGTTGGTGHLNNTGVTGVSNITNAVGATTSGSVNTTVQNTLSVTYQSGAATTSCTFQNCVIELL